jgi:ABC-type Fe3+/spermidine/putrescine transport system ATPase subunit
MNTDGQIEQVGTPKEIYEFPVSTFVAQFIGTTNLFKGVLHGTFLAIEGLGNFDIVSPAGKPWAFDGAHIFMSIRPEKIRISKQPLTGFSNMLQGTVKSIVYHGRSTQYNVKLKNDSIVQVFEQNEEHFPQEVIDYDNPVFLYWQKENVVLLER